MPLRLLKNLLNIFNICLIFYMGENFKNYFVNLSIILACDF